MKYVAKHGMSDLGRMRIVIDKAYESYAARLSDFNPQIEWKSDREAVVSFSVMKKTLSANFAVDEENVVITGDIPFLFKPFQGRIEKVLGEEMEKWLAKERAGEI